MSADSTATSVPAPIAMPMSAATSAGASFTPSPTIATVRPPSWKPCTAAALSAGRTCAATSSIPSRWATAVGDCLRVAGDHRHAHTEPMELGDRLRGLGSDLVLGREQSAMRPSTTTWSTVRPWRSHASARGSGSQAELA